jgi:hypothetical protein
MTDIDEPDLLAGLLAAIEAAPPNLGARLKAAEAAGALLPSDVETLRGELVGLAWLVVMYDDGRIAAAIRSLAERQRSRVWDAWWDLLPERPDR